MLELISHLNSHKVLLIVYTISYLNNLLKPHMDPTIWLWYLTINNLVIYSITSYGYHLWLWHLFISSSQVNYPYSLWIQPSPYGYLAISLRQLTFAIEIAKNTSKLWVKQVIAIWLWFPYFSLQTTLFPSASLMVQEIWLPKFTLSIH